MICEQKRLASAKGFPVLEPLLKDWTPVMFISYFATWNRISDRYAVPLSNTSSPLNVFFRISIGLQIFVFFSSYMMRRLPVFNVLFVLNGLSYYFIPNLVFFGDVQVIQNILIDF